MEKENVNELKSIRDKLSFVIFALSSKTQYDLKFSDDEARGFKEILNMLSDDLGKISEAYASEALTDEGSAEQKSDADYSGPSQF